MSSLLYFLGFSCIFGILLKPDDVSGVNSKSIVKINDFEEPNNYTIYNFLTEYKNILTFSNIWELYINQSDQNISVLCHQHITAAVKLLTKELWPHEMIDAWGKFPEGILSGHIGMLGDFEECMALTGNLRNSHNMTEEIRGRYCPMHLIISSTNSSSKYRLKENETDTKSIQENPPLYSIGEELSLLLTQPTLAVCLPSSCSRDDFNKLFSQLTSMTKGIVTPITSYCQVAEKPDFDGAVVAMIVVSSILIFITICGSVIDLIYSIRSRELPATTGVAIFLAFSLQKNVAKLISTEIPEANLGCLHGLRFLSICWVVLGHTWSIMSYSSIWNILRIGGFHKPWTLMTIVNGTFCVDTFFALSGFLIAYQLLANFDKSSGHFNPLIMYLHRYLRLTPTYAFLIGLIATFQPYLSNGPMWGIIEMNSKYCRRNWWQNLLYVNNLVTHNPDDLYDIPCFGEAWYLGCDMQFFLISIWIVYLIWINRRLGLLLLGILTVASICTPGAIIGSKNLNPTSIPLRPPTGNEKGNYDLDVYVKPWTRISPYFAGIWSGYLFYLTKQWHFKLPKHSAKIGWMVSTGIALSVLYGPINFFNIQLPLSKVETVIYGGFSRFMWGVAIGWTIYACVTGNGGLVNKLLSAKIFMPLGRTAFSVFLISYELQQMFHARYPHPLSYDVYFLTNIFLAHLTLSLIIGFGLTVFIESPFIQMEKIILGKLR